MYLRRHLSQTDYPKSLRWFKTYPKSLIYSWVLLICINKGYQIIPINQYSDNAWGSTATKMRPKWESFIVKQLTKVMLIYIYIYIRYSIHLYIFMPEIWPPNMPTFASEYTGLFALYIALKKLHLHRSFELSNKSTQKQENKKRQLRNKLRALREKTTQIKLRKLQTLTLAPTTSPTGTDDPRQILTPQPF